MIEILRNRRSIRKYTPEKIKDTQVQILQEALLRSPSSKGKNPWEFIFVDQPKILNQLSTCKAHGASFLKQAVLGIVICGDETKSDVWIEDCSIASILAHITAHSLGLGSCWVQIRKRMYTDEQSSEAYIQNLLGIPKHVRVESIIGVGYPDEYKKPVPSEKLDYRKIKYNEYTTIGR